MHPGKGMHMIFTQETTEPQFIQKENQISVFFKDLLQDRKEFFLIL